MDAAACCPKQGAPVMCKGRVRGTSFAAPLVAGRLFTTGSLSALKAEAKPGKREFGRGVICGSCRNLD
jgi:hypothetical protein